MVTPDNPPEATIAVASPVENQPIDLYESLNLFVAHKKEKATKSAKRTMESHQEIIRFIDWFGRDRKVGDLSPSQIEDYAKDFAQRGGEPHKKLVPVKEFLAFLHKQDWTEVNLSTHLRVSRARRTVAPRQTGVAGTPGNGPRLSEEGYHRLVEELDKYREERLRVDEEVKQAMEGKDFRENAPLDAAKERQGFVTAKIRELESEVANAQILSGEAEANAGMRVVVGSSIMVRELASGRQEKFILVDKREANAAERKISTVSPVGQALLDHTVGDEVEITVPKGTLTYRIEEIGA